MVPDVHVLDPDVGGVDLLRIRVSVRVRGRVRVRVTVTATPNPNPDLCVDLLQPADDVAQLYGAAREVEKAG